MNPSESRLTFFTRLRIYLGERFPIVVHGAMTLAMCAGSIAAFRRPQGFSLWAVLAAFLAVFCLFFIMRVADEHKDFAEDTAFRPERPVPRGLVSLGELRLAALATLSISVALAVFLAPPAMVPLLAALAWIGAMSVEFGVSAWLKARPVVYLVSHMLVMPFLALLAVSFAVGNAGDLVTPTILPVLALAFLAGATLEIGRKVWGAEKEREGVETYSKLWGSRIAAWVFGAVATAALAAAVIAAGGDGIVIGIAGLAALAVWVVTLRYRTLPDGKRAAHVQLAAGLVALLSYALCLLGGLLA